MLLARAYTSRSFIRHIMVASHNALHLSACGISSTDWHDMKDVTPEQLPDYELCKRCKARAQRPT